MNNLSDLLKYKFTSEVGGKISKELFFIEVAKKLEKILKENELKLIKPAYIKGTVLTFYCKNSIISSILKLKESIILEQLNTINSNFKIEKIFTQINDEF